MNIQVGDQSVYYQDRGQGDDVVFILQGWAAPCAVYDSIAMLLSSAYRVIQFDFPGFGKSDEPNEPWCVDDYADFFVAFAQALGISGGTLVGHSYGGRVIIKLAARQQTDFAIHRIALIDSAGLVRQRTRPEELRIRWFKLAKRVVNVGIIRKSFPDLIEHWMSQQGSEDYRRSSPVMKATMVRSISEDLASCLPSVAPEVLLIWGADDDATPLSDGQRMEREMPNATLVTIASAGHFPFLDQPEQFFGILSAYLVPGA